MGRRTAVEKIAACILFMQHQDKSGVEQSPIQLSRRELAEMLGLGEETICRVMAELRRTGIIEAPRGNVIVLDRDRLQDIADETPVSRYKPLKCTAAQ